MHPRYGIVRTYAARVRGTLTPSAKRSLMSGIELEDGEGRVRSVKELRADDELTTLLGELGKDESYIQLTVTEGRKHFVKRILEAQELPVIRLSRTALGDFTLGKLKPGEIRRVRFPNN